MFKAFKHFVKALSQKINNFLNFMKSFKLIKITLKVIKFYIEQTIYKQFISQIFEKYKDIFNFPNEFDLLIPTVRMSTS